MFHLPESRLGVLPTLNIRNMDHEMRSYLGCSFPLISKLPHTTPLQAEARFSGLHAVPETFWPWVQESPGRTAAAVSSG